MHGLDLPSWMTRREAAGFLQWSVEELDWHLVPLENHPAQLKGKMRYEVVALEDDLRVRILAADVFSIVPTSTLPNFVESAPERSLRSHPV